MIKIHTKDGKWIQSNTPPFGWDEHELDEQTFAKLREGKLEIDAETTTPEKLEFLPEEYTAKKNATKEAIKKGKTEVMEWATKLKNHIQKFDVWFTFSKEERQDLQELFLLVKENGEFPSLSILGQINPELYKKFQEIIAKNPELNPPEILLKK